MRRIVIRGHVPVRRARWDRIAGGGSRDREPLRAGTVRHPRRDRIVVAEAATDRAVQAQVRVPAAGDGDQVRVDGPRLTVGSDQARAADDAVSLGGGDGPAVAYV